MLMLRPLLILPLLSCAASVQVSSRERADAFRREGLHRNAFESYAAAFCEQPTDLGLARRFVESWDALGQPGSPTILTEECSIDEGPSAYVNGMIAGAKGETEAALAAMQRAERLLPTDAEGEIAYRRGLLLLAVERAEEALPVLQRAAALMPERAAVRFALAQTHLLLANPTEAIEVLRGSLAVELDEQDLRRGSKLLNAVVKSSELELPEKVDTELRMVLKQLERGEANQQTYARSRVLAAEHPHTRVLTVTGLVALELRLNDEATELLNRAGALNQFDPEPFKVLGASLYAAERPAEAVRPLKMAVLRNPFDLESAHRLAAASVAIGDMETALATYRQLVALQPAVAEHRLWLARMERRKGRMAVARRIAEQGCDLSKKNIPLLLELASIEAQLAMQAATDLEREEARERTEVVVERLLLVAPGHPAAAMILASLEQ